MDSLHPADAEPFQQMRAEKPSAPSNKNVFFLTNPLVTLST